MKLAKQMRRWGKICFIVMGVAFAVFFIGIMTLPYGSYNLEDLPFAIRYALIVALALFAPTLVLILGAEVPRTLADRALQAKGLPAQAKVLKVWKTGTRINRNPVMAVLLEVQPSSGPSFQAETEYLDSRFNAGGLQPGYTVQVKYNPQNFEVALADRHP